MLEPGRTRELLNDPAAEVVLDDTTIGRKPVCAVGILVTALSVFLAAMVIGYLVVQFVGPTATSSGQAAAAGGTSGGTSAAGRTAVHLLMWDLSLTHDIRLFYIVALTGGMGGLVHDLRSLYWYVGNRSIWRSWLLMYATMPILGSTLAILVYLVCGADSSRRSPPATQ